jgi:hypothetical protein
MVSERKHRILEQRSVVHISLSLGFGEPIAERKNYARLLACVGYGNIVSPNSKD